MITLLAIIGIIFLILVLVGVGFGIVAISPVLGVILLLPLIDFAVYKIIKAIKNRD